MTETHHPPKPRTPGRRSRTAAGLALAALATVGTLGLLSACGTSPHSSSAGASRPGAPPMSGMSMPTRHPGAETAVTGDAVAIKNFAFSPATLKVRVGTTVTWTNQDTDAHTVTSTGPGGPLHSPAMATHATYSHTFTRPGTYAYLCTVHPFMTATVEVTR
ncbi:plastocyanin/azurin family copper-binding protein [Streptomyces sp. NPDC008092]|uniref:plastocyanin/azurin family copper-binding protein n=1 Tax=Streptomyces sp. NPDC008092 TaxID=3364808 RepID=UPI0036E1E866